MQRRSRTVPHAHAVVAVKHLGGAKSRLALDFGTDDRARLTLAMLADTLTALVNSSAIVSLTVVTPDPQVAATARRFGADLVPDPPTTATASDERLNAALTHAAVRLRRRRGGVDVVALQADLPALRSQEVTDMLVAAPVGQRAVVVDHHDAGTTALVLRDANQPLRPMFGAQSARRHIDSGAVALAGDWPGLRLDADTASDLADAVNLGIGAHTRAVLADLGWLERRHRRADSVGRT
ncbi:MAG TPA: 2-phospho-L-lactate guanylyltransferase [Aldersonia sp.]